MAETAVAIQASGATGAACGEPGPYRSARNAKVVVFLKAGDNFPLDTDGVTTTWTLVTEEGW